MRRTSTLLQPVRAVMPLWLLSAPVCCENMSPDEAEAVIAHEISHIANGDMVTMTLIQGAW